MRSFEDQIVPIKTTRFVILDASSKVVVFEVLGEHVVLQETRGGLKVVYSANFIYDLTNSKTIKSRWFSDEDMNAQMAHFLEIAGRDLGLVEFVKDF